MSRPAPRDGHDGNKPIARRQSDLRIARGDAGDACLLTVEGVLADTTYLSLRDAIVNAALDEPNVVIVDINSLVVRDDAAWAVFTNARWQVSEWPDTPIGLVCAHDRGQNALRRNGITRYVPVYRTLQAAATELAADAARRYRRRVRAVLPATKTSTAQCRQFTTQWLAAWERTDFSHTVSIVATELVEMALADTDDPLVLRLETDGSTVTVAVQHSGSAEAKTVRRKSHAGKITEIDLIAANCRVWGSHTSAAGTTVWVVLGPENRI
jgi:hypothetical protein